MEFDPRIGSIWRKWDLHIHSNASDGIGTPKQIIAKAKVRHLAAIAITDHHTARNVDELKEEGKKEGIAVISGIEFRTDYGQKSVHMIGLFPDYFNNTKLDSKALHDLVLSPLGLSETKIISKGNEANTTKNDQEAFKKGMFLVQVSFKEAANIIHKFGGVVVVHAGSKSNSVEGMKHKGVGEKNVSTLYDSLGVVKEELFKEDYIDICEIRKEDDSEDFYYDKFKKPSVVGSDAHDLNDIGSRFVWIKANPTFEGLNQIKYEPKPGIRTYIGEIPPQAKDLNRIISSIKITNSKGWFEEVEIPINPDLCCIIGPKGSGKTALADIIALVGGEIGDKIDEEKTFLGKAIKELDDATIQLKWARGAESTIVVGTNEYSTVDKQVQYLSQGFVEKICSDDLEGVELASEIENVIFENLVETEKLSFSNFDSLRDSKTSTLRQKKEAYQNSIQKLNEDIFNLEIEIKALPEKRLGKSKLEREKEGIESQKNAIAYSSDAERSITDEIDKLLLSRNLLINQISDFKAKIQRTNDLKHKIEMQQMALKEFNEGVLEDLKFIGISEAEWVKFKVEINLETEKILERANSQFELKIGQLEGDDTANVPLSSTLAYVNKLIELLQSKSTLEKSKKDQLESFQKRINEISVAIAKIDSDIKDIVANKSDLLSEKIKKRIDHYNSFFRAVDEEDEVLKKLYAPIQKRLQDSKSSDEQLLSFETKKEVDSKKLGEKILSTLDRRKIGKYFNIPDEQAYHDVKQVYSGIMHSTSEEQRQKVINDFIESFTTTEFSIDGHLRDGYTLKDFYDSVFDTSDFDLNYSISFGGVALDNLTPGTKGIALLILYLGINQNEYRPLIIDQPEENLDNRSVYKVLKNYFREAKLRRQIIMVTHNPNLVVNTDAEQVIVANFDKEKKNQAAKICYISGSLENTKTFDGSKNILQSQGIREHTCEILEGGKDAFEERENKYRIK